MAVKKPICQYGGELKELQAGDALPLSGNVFPVVANFDGGGEALVVGTKCYVRMTKAGTIAKVTLLADQTGWAQVGIWKDSWANYPPTVADSITAANDPVIASGVKMEDATLTGWTKSISAGDVLAFNIEYCTTITRLTVILEVTAA